MKLTTLLLLAALSACASEQLIPEPASAQDEIDIPGDRPKDSDRTYLQCYAGPAEAPSGPDLVSVGKNGDRVFVDKAGGVSLWRVRSGKPELCLVVNWTGGSL